jgi:hypothetical protein
MPWQRPSAWKESTGRGLQRLSCFRVVLRLPQCVQECSPTGFRASNRGSAPNKVVVPTQIVLTEKDCVHTRTSRYRASCL